MYIYNMKGRYNLIYIKEQVLYTASSNYAGVACYNILNSRIQNNMTDICINLCLLISLLFSMMMHG